MQGYRKKKKRETKQLKLNEKPRKDQDNNNLHLLDNHPNHHNPQEVDSKKLAVSSGCSKLGLEERRSQK